MMGILLALALAQATPQHRLFLQPNLPAGETFGFFEVFPASGTGTSGVCSTTAPTGAKGEALTFTRTGNATCTATAAGGFSTSGIGDGELVEVPGNIPRVEYNSSGQLGARLETVSGINLLPRFIAFANASWSDVGTPALTGSQTSPFSGTYASSAVLFNDNDGSAFEGREQAITVSAGAAYLAHCLVKGGTLAKARIVLDGTAATITGLSTTKWSIIEVADASASSTSITLQVVNGDAASDTGTVIWGGCDVKAGTLRTSIVPTGATSATRNVETYYRDHGSLVQINCVAASYQMPTATIITGAATAIGVAGAADTTGTGGPPLGAIDNGGLLKGYANGIGYTGSGTSSATDRIRVSIPTGGVTARWGASSSSTAAGAPSGTARYFFIGMWNSTPINTGCQNCIVNRLVFETNEGACQ